MFTYKDFKSMDFESMDVLERIDKGAEELIKRFGPLTPYALCAIINTLPLTHVNETYFHNLTASKDSGLKAIEDLVYGSLISFVDGPNKALFPSYSCDEDYMDAFYKLYSQYQLLTKGEIDFESHVMTQKEREEKEVFDAYGSYPLGYVDRLRFSIEVLLEKTGPISLPALVYLYNTSKDCKCIISAGDVYYLVANSYDRLEIHFNLSPLATLPFVACKPKAPEDLMLKTPSYKEYTLAFHELYLRYKFIESNPGLARVPENWLNKAFNG